MARARIGKLFHLTPLVDSLADAEFFFDSVFSPLCMMRNYSPHWHRHAAIYVIAETSIEPMEVLPPPAGKEPTSWFRYTERFGMRVHNLAFYVEDIDDLERRLVDAGVRTTDAGSGNTLFCHPKDTPGMLEFFPYPHEIWDGLDPRMRPEWAPFRDAFWATHHPLGLKRMSHITIVVNDLAGRSRSRERRRVRHRGDVHDQRRREGARARHAPRRPGRHELGTRDRVRRRTHVGMRVPVDRSRTDR